MVGSVRLLWCYPIVLFCLSPCSGQLFFETVTPKLCEERMVFETQGTIEFAFYPEVST